MRASWLIVVVLGLSCGGNSKSDETPGAGALAGEGATGGAASSGGPGHESGGRTSPGGSSSSGANAEGGSSDTSPAGAGPESGSAGSATAAAGTGGGTAGSTTAQAGSGGTVPFRQQCSEASDCLIPETEPPGCAGVFCEFQRCRYFTDIDVDEDGAKAIGCVSQDPRIDIPAGNDCNDNDPNVNPGLEEQCNGFDDDCDGLSDFQYGTESTEPPAPFSTLECFDGTWWITSWHQDVHVSPPSPAPFGPVPITKATLFVGSDPGIDVPPALFQSDRGGTDAQGDQVTVTLNFQVLAEMPTRERTRVAEVFASAGTLALDVDIEAWDGFGLWIPVTDAPFRIP